MRLNKNQLFISEIISGKDGTKDFEVIGHSDDAKEMMKKYEIGDVDQSTVPLEHTTDPSMDFSYKAERGRQSFPQMLQILVPLVIIGVAFTIKIYTTWLYLFRGFFINENAFMLLREN